MMDSDTEAFWFAVAGGGAILLGIGLIPLRGLTPAANFTFAFMALTIVVAELGGRRAAIMSAIASALSLDFFLTAPYMRLTMTQGHDIVAFTGLATCGLIAAAFGRRHERHEASRRHLDLLHEALRTMEEAGPPAPTLSRVLDLARTALPLSGLAVRDEHGALVVGTDRAASHATPAVSLDPGSLLHPGATAEPTRRRRAPFPSAGLRLTLVAGNRSKGALDVWGSGRPTTAADRQVLSDLARAIGARLALVP